MSVTTSNRGRFQFSTENAYRVSASISSRAHVSTISRTECDPGPVPLDAGLALALRPAPVAVHDDRDVPRQPLRIDRSEQLFFDGSRRGQELTVFHSGPMLSKKG